MSSAELAQRVLKDKRWNNSCGLILAVSGTDESTEGTESLSQNMADISKQSKSRVTKDRPRTRSEGANRKIPPDNDRQRKLSVQSDRIPNTRKESSGSTSSTNEAAISEELKLSIQATDMQSARKGSSESCSEYTFDTKDESKYKGMVKTHYTSAATRSRCPHCKRKFSVKFRPHHCRRCGEIFCMKCLRYKRKLNQLARPDPNGKPRKVCKDCFNEEGVTLGCTRQLTEEFVKERQLCKQERVLKQRTASLTNTFWRDQLDMESECARLKRGFAEAVGTSEAKRTLHELHGMVKPPKWQKSSFWELEKQAASCRVCKGSLGMRKKKRNCKVCGLALCKKCSNRELLLYIDDENDRGKQAQPKMGIIKFAGCPEKEPDISLLLHICMDCKEYIIVQQTTTTPPNQSLITLISMNDVFTELQNKISPAVIQCEHIIESTEAEETQKTSFEHLSDILDQINEALDKYEGLFYTLKTLGKTADTRMQKTLIINYTRAKYEFYMENRHTYRRLRKTSKSEYNAIAGNYNEMAGVTEKNLRDGDLFRGVSTEINLIKASTGGETNTENVTDRSPIETSPSSDKTSKLAPFNKSKEEILRKLDSGKNLKECKEHIVSSNKKGHQYSVVHPKRNLIKQIETTSNPKSKPILDATSEYITESCKDDKPECDTIAGTSDKNRQSREISNRNSGEVFLMKHAVSWKHL